MDQFYDAILPLLSIKPLLALFLATSLGVIIGALPGLTTTMGVALLVGVASALPMTYTFVTLLGVFVGGVYGGSISAILLNIPGTPSAAATALDGYPFCLQGDEIPIGARIIRVCDVFVALISDRAYRKAFEPKTALLMVIDEVRHFDMNVFLAFQRIINTTDILDEVQSILKGSYKSQIS